MKVTLEPIQQADDHQHRPPRHVPGAPWRQFGAVNPDLNYIFWSPTNATTPGFAINMARNTDPNMQTALIKGRESPNQADRVAAYQEVNRLMGADIPYIWYDRTVWAVGAQPKVQNFDNPTTPAGGQGLRHDRRSRLAHPDLAELPDPADRPPARRGRAVVP